MLRVFNRLTPQSGPHGANSMGDPESNKLAAIIGGVLIFFLFWIFAALQWGVWGIALGWMLAVVVALIGAAMLYFIWPLVALGLCVAICFWAYQMNQERIDSERLKRTLATEQRQANAENPNDPLGILAK